MNVGNWQFRALVSECLNNNCGVENLKMSMFRSIVTNFCRGFGCLLAASCTIEMSVITRCPQGVK